MIRSWKIAGIILTVLLPSTVVFAQTCQNPGARMERIRSALSNKDTLYNSVKKDLQFIQLTKHDTIADIGSYDGYYPSIYSIFSDSVVFYLNDITNAGFVYFDSIQTLCIKAKGHAFSNQFNIVIGTDSSTNLPAHLFNKVIIQDALHHFKSIDKMLWDVKRIMKPRARLILFEPVRNPVSVNKNLCNGAMTNKELLKLMAKNGFELTRQLEVNADAGWFEFKLTKDL